MYLLNYLKVPAFHWHLPLLENFYRMWYPLHLGYFFPAPWSRGIFNLLWARNRVVLGQKSVWSGSTMWVNLSSFCQEGCNSLGTRFSTEGAQRPQCQSVPPSPVICLIALLLLLLLFLTQEGDTFIISHRELLVKVSFSHCNPAGWTQWYCRKYFISFYIRLSNGLKDMKYCHFPWTGIGRWPYVRINEKISDTYIFLKTLLPCFITTYTSLLSLVELVYSEQIKIKWTFHFNKYFDGRE